MSASASPVCPDEVPSVGTHARTHGEVAEAETVLDPGDYEELQKRYLLPRERKDEELPGSMRLHRQQKPPLIDVMCRWSDGYKKLKKQIQTLQKKKKHTEIYRLLRQLRDYEIHNQARPPECLRSLGETTTSDVQEVVDLTADDEEVIDVDKYILDVLLVNIVKADPDGIAETTNETAHIIVKMEDSSSLEGVDGQDSEQNNGK
jgi:hypothetical protein